MEIYAHNLLIFLNKPTIHVVLCNFSEKETLQFEYHFLDRQFDGMIGV